MLLLTVVMMTHQQILTDIHLMCRGCQQVQIINLDGQLLEVVQQVIAVELGLTILILELIRLLPTPITEVEI
jgi:hypothetical protein